MNKKGLSDIVTSVLIILLVLVSVAIIWLVVRNFISSSSSQLETGSFSVSFSVAPSSVKAITTGSKVSAEMNVKRSAGGADVDVSALNIVIEDSTGTAKTYKYIPPSEFKPLETKKISVGLDGLKDVSKISLVPVIKNQDGKEITSGISKIYSPQVGEQFVLPSGLVGYWKFDDESWPIGTLGAVKDSAGNLHGAAQGNAQLISDDSVFGKAGLFGGAGNIDLTASTGSIDVGTAGTNDKLTLITWINTASYNSPSLMYIVGGSLSSGSFNGYSLALQSNRVNILRSNSEGWLLSPALSANIYDNKWTMISVSVDESLSSDKAVFYINGDVLGKSSNVVFTLNTYTGQRRLGSFYDNSGNPQNFFNGKMDEVMIFNRALTPEEIKQIYNFFKKS